MAVDCLGRLLVADYEPGKVHIFGVDPSFKLLSAHCVSGLPGPRYVCPGPDGGLVVSEECGDVKLYGPCSKLVLSFSEKYNHCFGNPAGVCFDTEGNVFVADEQDLPPQRPPSSCGHPGSEEARWPGLLQPRTAVCRRHCG
ncbi:UNVERIFIED_CONTAM: hypothetical protein FKN15_000027 [Acipenser sinensis]